jgi:hypothetical protein
MLGIPALAQNTKGDKPAPAPRDTRFKTPKKASKQSRPATRIRRQDDKAGQRAGAPPARTRSRKGDRPGRPIRPMFSKSRPGKTQKAWKGDITGRRITPRSSSSRAHNVYPQPSQTNYSSRNLKRALRNNDNPNVKRVRRMQRKDDGKARVGKPIKPTFHKSHPQQRERAWRGDITGRPIRTRRSDNVGRPSDRSVPGVQPGRASRPRRPGVVPGRYSSRARNIFSGRSFYVNKQSQKRTPYGGGGGMSLSLDPNKRRLRVKDGRIVARSASGSFLRRKSINAWAHFKKQQRPRTRPDRDLAGHRLRGKNYETPRPDLMNPSLKYQKRVATGERAYKGPGGGYVSRTKSGRAWKGDIAHRAIRGGKPPTGRERAFLGFLKGGGFRSSTKPGEQRPGRPVMGKAPGMGAKGVATYKGRIRVGRRGLGDQGEAYTGNIRARKRPAGGGSVSGRVWNNNGIPIQGKTPGRGSKGIGYSGNIRVGRKGFNDQGEQYTGNIKVNGRRGFNEQGERYTGNIKVNGRRGFNEQGERYTGNIKVNGRRGFNDQGEEYTGNIKARRPDKGGGSRGGHWNNNERPILGKTPKAGSGRIAGYQGNIKAQRKILNDQGESYTGDIKARRPDKGGGSVSGKLWNNDGQALPSKYYSGQAKINRYSGNLKARKPEKGGGSVSGEIWNNEERPLPGKDYSYAKKLSRYSGDLKAKRPQKGGGDQGFDFPGHQKFARNDYKKNPKSADDAMRGRQASPAAFKADIAVRGSRRSWDYVRNPSSDDEAQKTREPGRAFTRSVDYQGNLKVKRFDLRGKRGLHPDAQFVKSNKNNVPEEKDMLTNFKLWWARLFRKSETQPDHLKEKGGKPRYDKGEAGLWYE